MNTLRRLFLPSILLSFGLVACAATTDDSVQGTEEALTSMKKTRLPNSPGWQVTCTASDGVSWTRQATDAEASNPHYCDAMDVPGERRGGFSSITDIPTSHGVSFDVEEKGNYLLKLPAYTEWIGDTSDPEAPNPSRLGVIVDNRCRHEVDVIATSEMPAAHAIVVSLEAGPHAIQLVQLNEYRSVAMGIDRNVLVGRIGLRKTNLPETVSQPGASCAIHTSAPDTGFDPFDARACTGTVLDEAKLKRLIAAGQTKRELGTMEIYTRERSCTAASGCGAWSAPKREYGELRYRPLNATVSLSLERPAPSPLQYGGVQYRPAVALAWDDACPPYTGHCTPASVPGKGPLSCGGTPGPYEWGYYYRADNTRVNQCVLREGGSHGDGTLAVKPSCAQLLSSATRGNSNAWTEYGYAGIARY